MSRIAPTFDALKQQGKTGLVTFITAGDPAPELTVPLLHALVEGGADVLELGVPFSDPMAEGPVIQRACERALAHRRQHERRASATCAEFRKTNQHTPVVLMGYANPIERMGPSELHPPRQGGRRRRRHRGRLSAGGMRSLRRRDAGERPRPDLPAGADLDGRARRSRWRATAAAFQLLRVAEGRDRRRQHRHRRRGAPRGRDPRARQAADRRRLRHPRRRRPRSRWPRWPMRW